MSEETIKEIWRLLLKIKKKRPKGMSPEAWKKLQGNKRIGGISRLR